MLPILLLFPLPGLFPLPIPEFPLPGLFPLPIPEFPLPGLLPPAPGDGRLLAIGFPGGRVGDFTLPPLTERAGVPAGLADGPADGLETAPDPRDAGCCIR